MPRQTDSKDRIGFAFDYSLKMLKAPSEPGLEN